MSLKVITIRESEGLPKGTVLQNCTHRLLPGDDNVYWYGLFCSMYGSYYELVNQQDCEIWDEEKHDLMFKIKKYLAQKNEIDVDSQRGEAVFASFKAIYGKE